MRILLVASSSGGHLFPAIALGNAWKETHTVRYLGIRGEMEERLISPCRLKTIVIPKSFRKSLSFSGISSLYRERKKVDAYVQEFDVIIAFGGFITAFLSLCPCLKNKRFYLHEQNVEVGDSNRFALRKAKAMFTSFPGTFKDHAKALYTGNPTVLRLKNGTLQYPSRFRVVFVFGSLSSSTLLDVVATYFDSPFFDRDIQYLLSVGEKNKDRFAMYKHRENIFITPFLDTKDAFYSADIIFTRAGATTLSELCFIGTNFVMIPSPYVKHHHQEKNADYLVNLGVAQQIKESEFTPSAIHETILNVRKNLVACEQQKRKQRELFAVDTLKRIEQAMDENQ